MRAKRSVCSPDVNTSHPADCARCVVDRVLYHCDAATATAAQVAPAPVPPVQAQHCALICAPAFTFTPALIRSHVFGTASVRALSNTAVIDIPSTNNAEVILGVGAPTFIPRLNMIASFQWLPTGTEATNPFTRYTASQLNANLRANTPSLTLGVSVSALQPATTNGWLGLSAYAGDLYSSATRATRAHSRTSLTLD